MLADPGPAAGAPRHRVVALVEPAAPVALRQEAPDQVVVLVAEREVRAAELRHPQPARRASPPVSVTGPPGPDQGRRGGRVRAQQVAQAAQLVGVVPVHPVAEPDRLLRLACRERQHALLAQAHELGDPVLLDVALRGEAEVALHVDLDPEALAVEAVLPALVLAAHGVEALEDVLVGSTPGVVDAHRVVGRDRPVEEAPPRPCPRSGRAGGRTSGARARGRGSRAPGRSRSGLLVTGANIGPRMRVGVWRAGGCSDRAVPATCGRHGVPDAPRGRSPYPTRDAAAAGTTLASTLGLHRGVPQPALPRARSCLRARLVPGRGIRGRALPPACPPRRRRPELQARGPGRRSAAAGAARDPGRQRRRATSTASSPPSTPTGSSATSTGSPTAAPGGSGRPGASLAPISLAGLLSVILVMGGAHAAVAYYDLQALDGGPEHLQPDRHGLRRPPRPPPAGTPGASTGTASPEPSLPSPAVGRGDGGAVARPVGRDRPPEHPAHRHGQAAQRGHLEHRHADRREHRPRLPAGRDVQPSRATRSASRSRRSRRGPSSGRPTGPRSTPSSCRRACGRTSSPGRRVRGPQGHPGLPLRDPDQLLRRGGLHGLQDRGRRAGRRDDQRPGPGRRRLLSRRQRARSASTSRPASST